jgi:ABC-type sugar transport system substrate-binding protein
MKYRNRKAIGILFLLPLLLLLCISIPGCTGENAASDRKRTDGSKESLLIGFSQVNHANPWRIAETNDIKKEAQRRGYRLILTDAESSSSKQVEDVACLISKKVDYIVLAPIEFEPLRPAILSAMKAGVPLILMDRMADGIPGEEFLTFVGSDFFEEGARIAQWLTNKLDGKARIVELRGRAGSSPATDRALGFRSVVNNYPNMEIVISRWANFERLEGQKVMEDIILSIGRDFDAVYAHNDEMAIGAIQALKAVGMQPGEDVILVSIDGEKDALKAIIAGELGASVECNPRFAVTVFDVIEKHQRGESIPPVIINEDKLFDIENAMEFIGDAF